jgi:surfactin synthase thioesterase subunit
MRSVLLFCLPYAGASAAVYSKWKRRLPGWIEVVPVELPGRGRRLSEPLETTFSGLLAHVAQQVKPPAGQEYALFGHSLGALLAFELAHHLERTRAPEPLVVFATGTHAPSRRNEERFARLDTDAELEAELVRLGGTPEHVLQNEELMTLILPILRADFRVAGNYRCTLGRRICAPLHVIGGTRDTTTPETLGAWREHTNGEFDLSWLSGGHFFVQTHESELLGLLEQRLARARDGLPA